jgi:hypothetical protein
MRLSLIVLYVAAGMLGGWVARQKGRNPVFWGLLTAIFPLFLVAIVFLPARLAPGRTRRCPHCGALTGTDSPACERCGRDLPIDMVACPRCGKYVPDGSYCSECGRSLHG